jgi:hypothetical protein
VCCFSVASPLSWIGRLFEPIAPKIHVSKTNIYARMVSPGVQVLAYGMNVKLRDPVAMILPLPVVRDAGEDAVKFIDLQKHPHMFDALASMFIYAQPLARKGGFSLSLPSLPRRLVVHDIGSFIASYVPTRADFSRLDPRFRVPEVLFDAVPAYNDYGFAVFQLAPGKVKVHPMAFTFPTRAPEKLFFPTVHVHDGSFKPTAKFDHALYYQHPRAMTDQRFNDDSVSWMTPANSYEDIVAIDQRLVQRTLHARLPNEDVWIDAT